MDFLLELAEPWGYLLIGALAAAEAAAFAGLFIPGEAAMLIGGFLVFRGRADLAWMLVAGSAGAVIGDSLGYEIGRRLGPRLEQGRLGRRIGHDRWRRASAYVRRHGGTSNFLGRFIGVLRALVPAVAGSAGMPYRTFLAYNAAGGIIWASGFILLGVAAGRSYKVVEQWAGRATLVLGAIVLVAFGLVVGARWIASHTDDLRAARDDLLARPRIARLRERYQRQIDFVAGRFDPEAQTGLYLTVGLAIALAGAWIFAGILQDVAGKEEIALVDRPVIEFLAGHRDPDLTAVMRALTLLGNNVFVAVAMALAAGISYLRTRARRWPAFLAATFIGAIGLDNLMKWIVNRPRPDIHPVIEVGGSSFPSGHAAAAAALFCAAAYVSTRDMHWRKASWIWAGALFAIFVVGFTRVYLGVHWPTDVAAGYALGGFWTAVTATATRLLAPPKVPAAEP